MSGRFAIASLLFLLLIQPCWAQEQSNAFKATERTDYSAAMKKWRAGAKKGDAASQFNLGLMYDEGLGVKQSYVWASLWYRKAALRGLPDAQNNLGVMYDNGFGVPQDPITAFQWFRKAAERGHAEAQNNLGVMYESGRGVEQDLSKALGWYRKAARQGHKGAKKSLLTILAKSQGARRKAPSVGPRQSYHLQLGSLRSRVQAEKASARLAKTHGAVLGSLKIFVVPTDLGDRGTFYRLRVGPLNDRASARKTCQTLSERNQDCFVIQP